MSSSKKTKKVSGKNIDDLELSKNSEKLYKKILKSRKQSIK